MRAIVKTRALLEREAELARIGALIERLPTGAGGAICIEGAAGIGKTRLVGAALELGRSAGLEVLSARGSELEREFAHGVVRQLFDPTVSSAGAAQRRRLLAGAARHAVAALDVASSTNGPSAMPAGEPNVAVLHGLYWLSVNLAETRPLLLVVDDVHWVDAPSQRFIEYLVGRLDGLPVGLVLAGRPAEPGADPAVLARVATRPGGELLRPRALSRDGVAQLIEHALGTGDDAFVDACHRLTAGSPFLVGELLRACVQDGIRPRASQAAAVSAMVPGAVAHATLLRLGRLPSDAAALARAVAVLGSEAELRHAATLAGLDEAHAFEAADLLAATEVLRRGRPLEFVHPLVRKAVHEDMALGERERMHRVAASLLLAEQAPPERTAVHLLAVEPRGNPGVVESLRSAAARASARGGPDVAAKYLRRALAEPPPPEIRAQVLLEAGMAETRAGEPDAVRHLEEALELTEDDAARVRAAVTLGRTLLVSDHRREAVESFERARERLAGASDDVRMLFEGAVGGAAMLDARVAPLVADRLAILEREAEARESVPVNVLAVLAMRAAMANRPHGDAVALARRALAGGGPLAGLAVEAPFFYHGAAALLFCERFDEVRPRYEQHLARARELGSAQQFAATSCFMSWLELRAGDVSSAEAHAQAALDAEALHSQPLFKPMILGKLIRALTEQGRVDAAETELARSKPTERSSLHYALFLHDRGVLRREQGRHEEALADLLDCGQRLACVDATSPGVVPWRSDAALTHLHLGNAEQAAGLAEEELRLARDFGTAGAQGTALRAAGLIAGGQQRTDLLSEAVAVLEDTPARLEHARALTDLGAALRRTNRRGQAREHLRCALDAALGCGATALAGRAEVELRATGARPRRLVLTGVDALTPSERRIATMAAEGMTNREIAQALFVTPRTVEGHLTHVFQKLDIDSRERLSAALTQGSPTRRSGPSTGP